VSLQEQAAAVAGQRDAARAHLLPLDDVRAACAVLATGIDALTFEERRRIIRTLCTRIVATRDRAIITGALPALSATAQLGPDGALITDNRPR